MRLVPVLLLVLVLAGCDTIIAAQLFYANDGTPGRWETEASYIEVPFKLETVVLIPIQINQGQVLDFALDTGAPMMALIGNEATDRLKLSLGAEIPLGGTGVGKTPTGRIVRDLTVSLANISLMNQSAILMPWQQIPFFEASEEVFLDGIIGYDVFKRYVVELDFERMVMTLYPPEQYTYEGTGDVFTLDMIGRKPYMNAEVTILNGQSTPVTLHVDLGNGGALSLIPSSRPEIVIPETVIPAEGWGMSGKTRSVVGRIKQLSLGAHRIDSVLTTFSLAGYATAGGRHGVLGLQILKRFKVIFDYQQNRMILERTTRTNEPFIANMSGLRFSAYADTYVIGRVEEGTPASKAGLQARDLLESINGRPAQSIAKWELDQYLRSGDGVELDMCVKRGTQPVCVQIQLEKEDVMCHRLCI